MMRGKCLKRVKKKHYTTNNRCIIMSNYEYEFAGWTKFIKESEIRRLLTVKVKYSFGGGMPAALPLNAFAEILKELGKNFEEEISAGRGHENVYPNMNYGPTTGLESLRKTLTERMIRRDKLDYLDLETGWQNVMITTGSQQSIYLLLDTLLNPGDIILSPAPCYLGFLGPAQKLGAKIITVETDFDGVIPESLEGAIRACKTKYGKVPKLLYIVPDSDNPKGTMLPESRRKTIFDICVAEGVLIVEDAAYKEMYFSGDKIPPIKHLDKENEFVCFLSSSSKEAAVLRMGYTIVPPPIFNEMAKAKGYLDLCTPSLNQKILDIYYTRYMDKSLKKVRSVYRKRAEAMLGAIQEHMDDTCNYTKPRGGFFVWAELKDKKFNATTFLEEVAIPNSILYVPGAAFYPLPDRSESYNMGTSSLEPGKPEVNTMRINYSAPNVKQIEDGIKQLGDLIRDDINS